MMILSSSRSPLIIGNKYSKVFSFKEDPLISKFGIGYVISSVLINQVYRILGVFGTG
jgi:hypothetical protein